MVLNIKSESGSIGCMGTLVSLEIRPITGEGEWSPLTIRLY